MGFVIFEGFIVNSAVFKSLLPINNGLPNSKNNNNFLFVYMMHGNKM